ncbi:MULTISPECIES: aminomethyl-transferring glycine dehydrogenase subunit GcvPA [Clostridium]|uniref:Glycine dehydrogenase subunit 1 n=2 Tax=Clostridium cadaveris TaxID=1529 RepID=A0A1I2MRK0_9CLOT|nr:aminomethyl-transferring glycine dehydrogenase subunit GcvPA [Clostridium cadaveris]MDM8312499.1 aminomethyl-transferring glycine dehydrogenase subunit GcvPA [Clostridium cadaveris]MDU4951856.1 aminomethyl-transferring glycine dehydrogenase subunit GcvPA [Clostridium sp.]SFF92097.1 glycine dehydrogenase subunit 1 [Clostridium cadaveris]
MRGFKNHPYIPNSVPEVEAEMLKEIGMNSLDELHKNVPELLKLKKEMNLPEAFQSEYELRRHVERILDKNANCKKNLNFLGAGCWQHYVPAICDEINGKGEFLTAYGGEPYNDEGRFQSLFEYASMVAELVDMDVVNVPTMDWAQAAATTARMAQRITNRTTVLVPEIMDQEKLDVMKNYCESVIKFETVKCNAKGQLDLTDLKSKVNSDTVGVYFENPNYFGIIEENGEEISKIVHEAGGLSLVGIDPISLGVLAAPPSYGADIVCGDLQPLGIHMNYGGGQSGFMATKDDEKFVMEFPSRLFGIAPTTTPGEYGFGDVAYDRTSFGHHREHGKEYVGTQSALWGITAGVYLATMGPCGMYEIGQTIMQNAQYAAKKLSSIPNVKVNSFGSTFFKEFVVDFSSTGKTVSEINKELLNRNIFGGKDLSETFPALGQCALYCVTEIHTKEDIDTLVKEISDIVK